MESADPRCNFVISGLAQHHVREAARMLGSDGHLLILIFAYNDDPAANENEVRRLAREAGLSVRHSGTQDFSLWDGTCFLLQKLRGQERSM